MANEHLILCGGARSTSRKAAWQSAKSVELRINEEPGRLNVRIEDLTSRLQSNLTDLELDLIEIATYVYGADQASTRGGTVRIDYGNAWYRDFRFEIPVRKPDFWSSDEVLDDLTRTLNDLSGDNFEFAFHHKPTAPPTYFEWGKDDATDISQVMLFSGGIDSFGGAVEEILTRKQKVVLVSHRANPKIAPYQERLVTDLTNLLEDKRLAPIHIPMWVNKDQDITKDYTQRTRSFLFASIASIVARLFGLKCIKFYENGITSMNLPVSPQVVSTRASRSTHPKPLSGMCSLFSRVFEDGFGILNPYFWKTKTQILKDIKAAGQSGLCASTVSCVHTREMTNEQPHCGKCSQCLDRRLVALAANYTTTEDPPNGYRFNTFEDSLEGADRVLFEGYAQIVNRIQGIDNAVQFCVAYPEITRAINLINGNADQAAAAIFQLYKQHADEVGGALDERGRQAFSRLRRGKLPTDCFLSILAGGLRPAPATPTAQSPMDTPAETGANGLLVIDESAFQISWQGNGPHPVGNKKEFHLLSQLWIARGRFVSHTDLAERLGGDDNDKVTHIKSRLVKFLKDRGLTDLAGMIKTQKGHYGLFIS